MMMMMKSTFTSHEYMNSSATVCSDLRGNFHSLGSEQEFGGVSCLHVLKQNNR